MSLKQGNINELETNPIGKLLWKYSLPAIVGMLVMSLYNVIDRIFIGQGVGSDAIAGLAITFPVMNISAAIGILIGAGAAARISILLGAKDRQGAEMVLGNALVLILINAIIYIFLFAIFIDEILIQFGASEATLPYARDFMMYLLPGMLVMNVMYSFNSIMRSSGYPAKAMITMIIGAVANVILAPIFIFWLDMGIKGAAIATDISMTISGVFVMTHFLKPDKNLHFVKGIYRLRWSVVYPIIAIGAAPSLVNAASSAINAIINTTLFKYGGDSAIAAAGIFTTYTSLLTTIVVGLCQGMQPIVGYNYGAGRLDRLKRTFWLATCVGLGVTIIGAAFGQSFPGLIARAFAKDTTLIDATINGLTITLTLFYVVGFQIVATTFLQSIGMAGKSIFLSLVRQVVFLIPFLLILPNHFGLNGVWASFPTSDVFSTVTAALMIWWEFRQLDKKQRAIRNT